MTGTCGMATGEMVVFLFAACRAVSHELLSHQCAGGCGRFCLCFQLLRGLAVFVFALLLTLAVNLSRLYAGLLQADLEQITQLAEQLAPAQGFLSITLFIGLSRLFISLSEGQRVRLHQLV